MKKITLMVLGLMFINESFAVELKLNNVTTRSGVVQVQTLESGITVYVFDPDQGAATPVCQADCAEKWPPVLITAKEETELHQAGLGTIKRATGLIQLTFKGRPLYTFFADRVAGEAKGDGLGSVWHIVRP